jgi:hypothetical protein
MASQKAPVREGLCIYTWSLLLYLLYIIYNGLHLLSLSLTKTLFKIGEFFWFTLILYIYCAEKVL